MTGVARLHAIGFRNVSFWRCIIDAKFAEKHGDYENMLIPESKLSAWSHHGPQQASIRTHETIRRALDNHQWPQGMSYDFYLQGSYHNDTNLTGDSDVDVVLELKSDFRHDLSTLSQQERNLLLSSFETPAYDWNDFRRETLKALAGSFGKALVGQGNKSVRLKGASQRLTADVVVCIEYRRYTSRHSYIPGIAFQALKDKHWVFNFPKLHHDNGAEKGRRTGDRYKRTVRMFKSARNHLESTNQIGSKTAPSYFLECLLYNAPDSAYQSGFQDTFRSIVNWMTQTDLQNLVCQNEQQHLFGGSQEQWSVKSAKTLAKQLGSLWDNWS